MLPRQEETLNDRLKKLINQSKIMLFMKGHPNEPKCGFSRQTTAILNNTGFVMSLKENSDYSELKLFKKI